MGTATTFDLIADERHRLADLASSFTPEQWATQSLAEGWRVQEVIAHLTMPFHVGLPAMVLGIVRHRGSFDRFVDRWARHTGAATDPVELVEDLRAHAGSQFTPPGLGPEAPLTDVVVHGLDVRVPLGLPTDDADAEAVQVALGFLTTSAGKNFGVRGAPFDGVRLEATDVDWAHGTGAVRRAPAADLLLHLCRQRPLPDA